jgi:large repetitive protein
MIATLSDKSSEEVTELATWTSSDPDVDEITADGEVTALKEGSTTLTVRFGGKTAKIKIYVE